MARRPRQIISRRAALAGLAATAAYSPAVAETIQSGATTENGVGPVFSASGPDAERYGAAEGYPIADPTLARQPGEPHELKYRVGAYSHFDEIFPTRRIERAAAPWLFKRSQADIRYWYRGGRSSVAEYLSRNPVTGLLIAKDDRILLENYQYGRTDRDRFLSQSMGKTITAILIGLAISEGAIKSVDDTPEIYVPGFKGTEYGKTPIRDLLHMSSGVEFGEGKDGGRDLDRLWIDMMGGYGPPAKGTIDSIVQFNRRIAAPGTRFYYASIEADVLGVTLRYAVGKPASDYLHEKVWEPIGAESDATWLLASDGFEVMHGFLNAVLRDFARLGRLLAHDGEWNGQQILPTQWMVDATTVRASDGYLAPGRAAPMLGYGYLVWLLPGTRRQFALIGANGQRICVDPISKLILVQTAVENTDEVWRLWSALVEQFG
jgi:CubicO group peptidase (beta-lactamase class C family)